MLYKFSYYFLVFLIYSFLGYICEIISVARVRKKIILSRGYLIGPYLPIFGFGSLIITLFLMDYSEQPLTLFVLGMVYCCTLEYLTSLLLEKIFKLRWWDYSSRKLNINGRVCLETGLFFGLGTIVMVRVFNKILFHLLDKIPKDTLIILAVILFLIVIIDFIFSTLTIIRLKIDTTKFNKKDATDEIKRKVYESIKKHSYSYTRFLKAFPHINNSNKAFEKVYITLKNIKKDRGEQNEK